MLIMALPYGWYEDPELKTFNCEPWLYLHGTLDMRNEHDLFTFITRPEKLEPGIYDCTVVVRDKNGSWSSVACRFFFWHSQNRDMNRGLVVDITDSQGLEEARIHYEAKADTLMDPNLLDQLNRDMCQ